jgi:bifunctional non-homologous end joining protein LigD
MAARKTGIKAAYPGFIEPALATSIEKVPSGEGWVHEIKFDGYRVQVHVRDAAVKLFTRRGNDWSNRLRKIASDAWHINVGSAIIDGEIVAPAADGTTDFSVLQNELKGRSTKIVMVAFDLLYLNGYDLRKLPLFERKALLKKLVADTDVQFSDSFEVDGREMFKHACKTGLEGVVSKVRDSKYPTGRSNDWVTARPPLREEPPPRVSSYELSKCRRAMGTLREAARDRDWQGGLGLAHSRLGSVEFRVMIYRNQLPR